MRPIAAAFVFVTLTFLAAPVLAGNLTYNNGQGNWQPASCAKPQVPAAVKHDPEASADFLNAKFMEHKKYVSAAQDYMNCISKEAQQDASGAGQLVIGLAEGEIKSVNDEATKVAEQMEKLRQMLIAKSK